jgi:lipopolysaccharide/colanic/teichoic acid biosynthesis glycosyltransferase
MSKMSRLKKFATYGLPALLWMAVIFPVGKRAFGSSRIFEVFAAVFQGLFPDASAHALGVAYILFRKTLHFLAYGLLAFLLYRGFRSGRRPYWSKRTAAVSTVAAIAYSLLDEFLQSLLPYRTGSPIDSAIDTAGVLTAIGLLARTGARRDAGRGAAAGRMLWLKRPFDVALASFGLILSAPLWLAIALAVRLEDGGPVFYAQERVGRDGRVFKALKFRSMAVDAEKASGPVQAVANDPRVTRVGRVLRATAMDELPQLLNIFKGDMSFVGPRALRPDEQEVNGGGGPTAIAAIPGYDARHAVRPGLTGLAQVFLPGETPRRKKFRYDLLYIRKRSFAFDLRLIALSFWITFRGKWESREPKV